MHLVQRKEGADVKKPEHVVTDHAVIRYLERVYGVDIQAVRRRIAATTHVARTFGAGGCQADGVRYVIQDGTVITIHGIHKPMSKRALRWKARRK